MSDLETLIPPGVQITVAGETLTLKPLKVGSLPAFLRAEVAWLSRTDDAIVRLASEQLAPALAARLAVCC